MLSACAPGSDRHAYETLAAQIRRARPLVGTGGAALNHELVQYATLAPSSHNTQCWRFALEDAAITVLPDPLRRCPAVDPDDHHIYVSLGCATENLVHAVSPLFNAITARQCTRGDYDGRPLSNEDLGLLERAGTSNGVRMLLWTDRPAIERVLNYVVAHASM
jgi:hypothetical protein